MQVTPQSEEISLRVRIDDTERLAVLSQCEIVDTRPEPDFEMLIEAIQLRCCVPMTAIAFVDRDRMWMKASRGFDVPAIPRSQCFCSVCMHYTPPTIISDTLLDPRFCGNLLVVGGPRLRFYAGFPIFSQEGYGLGSVCAIDIKPRSLNTSQLTLLEKARDWVEASIEVRRLESQSAGCVKADDALLRRAQSKRAKTWERVSQLF